MQVLQRLLLTLFLLISVQGMCAADKPDSAAAAPSAESDYLLHPSDLLRIQVFQEEDLTRDVRISQEYSINLPLIGKVDLRGKTLRQAEEMVRALYDRDFLVNPQITLIVMEYAKRTVNVLGAVNTPGAVAFPEEKELSLLDAITRAGGFSRLAERRKIKLTRTSPDGKTETFIINADQLIEGSDGAAWPLTVNDVIFVPERIL